MKKRKKKTAEAAAPSAPEVAGERTSVDPVAPEAVPQSSDGEDEPTQPYFEPPVFETAEEPTQVTGDAGIPGAQKEAAAGGALDGTWERPTLVANLAEVEALAARSAQMGEGGEAGAGGEGREAGDGGEGADGGEAREAAEGESGEAGGGGEAREAADGGEGGEDPAAPAVDSAGRLESILESLIFASDRPLGINELKRLVNERDGKKLGVALEALRARHEDTGIQLAGVAGGWQFRTHPVNGPWVGKLVAGRPVRLSRAMLETLAIVAYRQPITRPEMDEIRGVDCGPVLKTLLDRNLVRMIGKKEDVGRPILYGTTPEFLRTFSLRDLTELPTLREFHELGEAEMAKVDAKAPKPEGAAPAAPTSMPAPTELPTPDEDEEDELLSDLDRATAMAATAAKSREPEPPSEGGDETHA
jgi:segregation and condensation protein B